MAVETGKNRLGKFQFLALRDEVRQMVESGLPVNYIWQQLTDDKRLDLSYAQFSRYVRRYITGKIGDKSKPANQTSSNSSSSNKPQDAPASPSRDLGIKSFQHKTQPDDDLI